LLKHPLVSEVAVVAMPDAKWGEVPCAFVQLHSGAGPINAEDLIKWARENMAHFQAPKKIIFTELPKTSTGKVLKHELRKRIPQV
jgi:fatty-acyl-CoA synthase